MKLAEILQIEDSPLAFELRHTVGVIDTLHRFPKTSRFPLKLTRTRFDSGAYNHAIRPPRALRIEVSIHADFPALTLVHEVGHFLDHIVLNPLKHEFASEHDSLFESLRNFWVNSSQVHELTGLLRRKRALPIADSRFIRYQLRIQELWARTYVQWVVFKSADILLNSSFRRTLGKSTFIAGKARHFYWDGDEANDIMKLVDYIFASRGYL